MPQYGDLVQVAKTLKQRLNGKAFETMPRFEITEILRKVSGEDATRLKTAMAQDLEYALLEQGVRVYPKLQDTTTGDNVRLFHPGTVVASIVDMIMYPSQTTDKELAEVTRKVKGLWDWGK